MLLLAGPAVAGEAKKAGKEEGEFRILLQGKEIGFEKFVIVAEADSVNSSSTVEFRTSGNSRTKVHLETKLEMDARFVPRRYQCSIDVDGKRANISSNISPNEAMFEYTGTPQPRKNGVLVGERYTILDSNVFHHFIFLSRLFDFDSNERIQQMEVVIPQEMDEGVLKMSRRERETIQVRGKKKETRHLKVDSGSVQMDLWVDDQRNLQKIAVPDKGIEVIRSR